METSADSLDSPAPSGLSDAGSPAPSGNSGDGSPAASGFAGTGTGDSLGKAAGEGSPQRRGPTYYELSAPPELDWRPYRPESYREYRREWERRGSEGDPGEFPLHLDIDPTSRCNLRCRMCPRTFYVERGETAWSPGGTGDMDLGLYRELVGEAARLGARSVKLNFLGEPLLHPEITEMVRLASAAGLWVMMNTNAALLDPEASRALLEAGLTDVFFSFDSPYPEEYERVRRGASYAGTLANIRGFMEIRDRLGLRHVQTRASMVLPEDPEGREGAKRDYVRLFRGLGVAEVGFGLPTVMGRDYAPLNEGLDFACPDLFRRVFVFRDGVAGPCCGDWERRLVVGNAKDSPLAAVWKSEAYSLLRERHLTGRFRDEPACRSCSVPYLSSLGEP
ncbi:MAG: radical SAM protein [Deltaproteobacteria bacterium]|jgi:MoaA/NifB/PqqE/SkfB family radical SAM enzyme|nr:radical SAM protein [Deltaproteobacteria bacterium]